MMSKRINPYPLHNPVEYSGHTSNADSHWKGRVISFEQWNKIPEPKDKLVFFPDEYHEHPFLLGVPDNIREDANVWYKNYLELMDFKKDPKYGKENAGIVYLIQIMMEVILVSTSL